MSVQRLDRLSALLEGLAPEVTLAAAAADLADGSPSHPAPPYLWLHLVIRGEVRLKGGRQTQAIRSPSLVALRSDLPYTLDAVGAGDSCRWIRAWARLTGPVATLFLEEFEQPRVVVLSQDEPSLHLAVTLIEAELDAPRCGQPALLDRAGDILFIGLLRHLVAHPSPQGSGLFNGLADPRIARALVAIHQRPNLDWSLERLSEEAGMSRTAFASTFREVMKRTPGKYLSAIRLAMAQRAVELGKGLKEAARAAGYSNVSALSRALSKARAHAGSERIG